MKKAISLALIFAVTFTLCSCAKENPYTDNSVTEETTAAEETTVTQSIATSEISVETTVSETTTAAEVSEPPISPISKSISAYELFRTLHKDMTIDEVKKAITTQLPSANFKETNEYLTIQFEITINSIPCKAGCTFLDKKLFSIFVYANDCWDSADEIWEYSNTIKADIRKMRDDAKSNGIHISGERDTYNDNNELTGYEIIIGDSNYSFSVNNEPLGINFCAYYDTF